MNFLANFLMEFKIEHFLGKFLEISVSKFLFGLMLRIRSVLNTFVLRFLKHFVFQHSSVECIQLENINSLLMMEVRGFSSLIFDFVV